MFLIAFRTDVIALKFYTEILWRLTAGIDIFVNVVLTNGYSLNGMPFKNRGQIVKFLWWAHWCNSRGMNIKVRYQTIPKFFK